MTLYDMETDTVLHQIADAMLPARSFSFNGHNGTIVTARLNQLFVHDLNYKLVQSFDTQQNHQAVELVQVLDEFTVLVAVQAGGPVHTSLYDLRTNQSLFAHKGLFHVSILTQYFLLWQYTHWPAYSAPRHDRLDAATAVNSFLQSADGDRVALALAADRVDGADGTIPAPDQLALLNQFHCGTDRNTRLLFRSHFVP